LCRACEEAGRIPVELLGYHIQWKNKGGFLSLDFVLKEFGVKNKRNRLRYYREFVYKKGDINSIDKERKKEFVSGMYKQFKVYFASKHKKKPKAVQGLERVFSLKRLSENT
jgi:putative transposase